MVLMLRSAFVFRAIFHKPVQVNPQPHDSDPHSLYADPDQDPACLTNADPDPITDLDTDPIPGSKLANFFRVK
jgi:hypothetical protein